MVTNIVKPAIIIKNVELNGSQFLAQERMIKDKKLIEGPGMTGKIQPIRPHNAKSNPEIINMIVKVVRPKV